MDLTYDQIIQALPELFALLYLALSLALGAETVYQARKLFDALYRKGKRFMDDENDWLIKQVSKAFKITPEEVIRALDDVSGAAMAPEKMPPDPATLPAPVEK